MVTKPTHPTFLTALCPSPSPTTSPLVQGATTTPGLPRGCLNWSAHRQPCPSAVWSCYSLFKATGWLPHFLLGLAWWKFLSNLGSAPSHSPHTLQLSQSKPPQGFLNLSPHAIYFLTHNLSPMCPTKSWGSLSSLTSECQTLVSVSRKCVCVMHRSVAPTRGVMCGVVHSRTIHS